MKTNEQELKRILRAIKNGEDWDSQEYQLVKLNNLYYLTNGWPLPFDDYIKEVSNEGYSDHLIDEDPEELGYLVLDNGTYLSIYAALEEVKLFNKETIRREKADSLEHLTYNNWANKFQYFPINVLDREEQKLKKEAEKLEIFITAFSNYKDVSKARRIKKQLQFLTIRRELIKQEERANNGG